MIPVQKLSRNFAAFVLALGVAAGAELATAAPAPRHEDFAGADACVRCHPGQSTAWRESTHGRAGGTPGEVTLLARFDGRPLEFKDAVVIPTNEPGRGPLFRVTPEGGPSFEIPVDAVVGGGHMVGGGTQSFFHRLPDGTLRFLPFDFIRQENLWFVQLREGLAWVPVSRDIALRTDLANWPPQRVLGTVSEFSNCQNCHASQLTAGRDAAGLRFETRFASLRIDCESCHGPARRHVEIVSRAGFETNADLGLPALATLSKEDSVQICLRCHANKEVLREDPWLPGAPLDDYFSVKLPVLGENPYHPDGRIRTFGYQGNHLFSDCYRNGSMTCVDCHEPHGQHYRDAFGRALPGRFDNGQCTACHASKVGANHSHHPAGSPGDACVACHMPYLQHPGIGSRLRFARSDHSIPIPRPAFDEALGLENACRKCHPDRDLAWQERWSRQWWGTMKPHPAAVTGQLRAANVTNPVEAASWLLRPGSGHPFAETAALADWMRRFLRPGLPPDERLTAPLLAFARGADPDLRALGLLALDTGFRQDPAVSAFLAEPSRLPAGVRLRWSVAADTLASLRVAGGEWPAARSLLERSVVVDPGNFVAMSHLALAHWQAGEGDATVHWLRQALRVQPNKPALHFQLAQTLARLGRVAEALECLEAGRRLAPDDPAALRLLEQLRAR